jgi:hypothetical protein
MNSFLFAAVLVRASSKGAVSSSFKVLDSSDNIFFLSIIDNQKVANLSSNDD